jgi:hypothetical protein
MRMNIMIDLETLGTGHRSVVTQLGWAAFDLDGPEGVTASRRYSLDPEEQIKMGRKADWSTIAWWLGQSDAARKAMCEGPVSSLWNVIPTFDREHNWSLYEGVWGHGATFDITILESLHNEVDWRVPWNFKSVRDTRTLFSFAPKVEWPVNPVKHDSEQDAIAQAIAVQRAVRALEART